MKQQVIQVKINSFSPKGYGVGTFLKDEKEHLVEVPYAIPGDLVETRLLKKKRKRYQSSLESVLTPSEDRVTPKCLHSGTCGGCRWQQFHYEKQLEVKEKGIKAHFSSLITDSTRLDPIIPCDPPWNYRNKMEFSFSSDLAGTKYLGLIMNQGRGKVVDLQECHLGPPWFTEALHVVRKWWEESSLKAYHHYRDTGSLRTLTVRDSLAHGDRLVMLTVSGNPDYAIPKKELERFAAVIKDSLTPESPGKLSIYLRIQQIAKGKETEFYEMKLFGEEQLRETLFVRERHLQFGVSPSAFFQPNTRQAEKLYSKALELASIPQDGVVYDLYCGTGTLGISAAALAKQVIGIELSLESSLDAKTNCDRNGVENVEIITGAVESVLEEAVQKFGSADLVIVDPPRAGLHPHAIEQIIKLNPEKILYISCNPATQAENCGPLVSGGYQIAHIVPVDQFPHTVHVENIVLLERVSC